MPRLPLPGQDSGSWGDVLNDYLSTVHNSDGTLKAGVITASHIAEGAITPDLLDAGLQDKVNAISAGETNLTVTTSATTVTIDNDTGSDATLSAATTTNAGVMTAADRIKLDGIMAGAQVVSVAGRTGAVTLTKTDVGLSAVDNTSDTNKPISTATQTALDGKASSTISITGTHSLSGGGSLAANRTLSLVNDSASPGNDKFYGTNSSGTRGFHDVSALNTAALRSTDANIYYDSGTSSYPLRSTATSDTLRRVRWIGPVAPTAGGGYALSGLDVWEKTA